MTISPINAAAVAHLSGVEDGLPVVTAAPHPELDRLLNVEAEYGTISKSEYRTAVRVLGKSKRQIQRELAKLRELAGTGRPKCSFTLTDHHKHVIMACVGNVRMAHADLVAAGEDLPSYDTFRRAWYQMPMGVQDYARHGATGLVNFWLYQPHEAPQRNTVWQADHFELPVDVIADNCLTTLVKPWLTLMVDDKTRKIMAWAVTASPGRRADAVTVCATLAAGIQIRLEQGIEVGGVPSIVRWDNDLSFTAGMVLQMGTTVGFECHAVPPYSGHMKGKIERLGRTVQEQFCVKQPGYTHGPKTYTFKDLFRDTTPITVDVLRSRLEQWFAEYDNRLHSSIGMTPLEAWAADTTPLRRVDPAKLHLALLCDPHPHKILHRKGISFQHPANKSRGRTYWQSGPLMHKTGQMVEVRYSISDDSFIEVFQHDKWVGTAWRSDRLTPDQYQQLHDGRDDQYREAKDLHEAATRLRVGADAVAGETDATPAIASMPADDQLAANPDDLYSLLAGIGGAGAEGDEGPEANGVEEGA
jgi:putative transposase